MKRHTAATLLSLLAAPTSAAQPVEYRVVAAEGQQATGLPVGVTYRSFEMPQLSIPGNTGFVSSIQGIGVNQANDRVLYIESNETLYAVAREGDVAQGDPGGGYYVDFGRQNTFGQSAPTPLFNSSGRFSFVAKLDRGDEGVWQNWSQPGNIRTILLEGYGAAGTTFMVDDLFHCDASVPAFTLTNNFALHFKLRGEDLPSTSDTGIWGTDDRGLSTVLIAREGEQAPGLDAGVVFRGFGCPTVGGFGRTEFHAYCEGPGITEDNNEGVWAWTGSGVLYLQFREGDQAPRFSPDTRISSIRPFVSLYGKLYYLMTITGPDITDSNDQVILSNRQSSLRELYREGAQAPGLTSGVRIGSIEDVFISDSDTIAFVSKLTGPGVTSANDECIWFEKWDKDLVLGAREGDQAPGFPPGYTFRSFRVTYPDGSLGPDPSTRTGRIAFTGELLWPGFDPHNPLVGSWVSDQRGELRAVAPPGTPITVSPGNTQTVERSQILPTGSVNSSDMVAAWVQFTDGTSAVVVESIDFGCVADVNGDGVTSPADFSAWVAAFNAGSLPCDQNFNGLCSSSDFSAWVSNYALGCP